MEYEWAISIEKFWLKVSEEERDFYNDLREFRYTFNDAKGLITVPASLTATAIRDFTFLVTLEMKNKYGDKYEVLKDKF